MKRPQNYHEGRCSASINSIIKQEEEVALVISNRKETDEQQSDVMMMKDESHFGGFKRLKVKGLIKP